MAATSTTKQDKRSMMVRFDIQSCEVYEIEHLNDWTDEQVAATWLTRKEWKAIHDGYNAAVSRLLIGGEEFHDANDEHATGRGLEPWIPKFGIEKSEMIYHSVRAVLVEQELQRSDDIYDDDLLADAYRTYLGNSTEQAYRMALDDEQVANNIYEEEEGEGSNNCVVVERNNRSKKNKKTTHSTTQISVSKRNGQYCSMIKQLKGAVKSMRLVR